jgi:hypothetical protein
MINRNNTEFNGPKVNGHRFSPLVFKSKGGDLTAPVPARGYQVAYFDHSDYETGSADVTDGARLSGGYPIINTNSTRNTGTDIYQPVKIAFVHKFGGPNTETEGELPRLGKDEHAGIRYSMEEFLRVNIPKNHKDRVFTPYHCAVLTAITIPYGKTQTGSIEPKGNRVASSLFRQRFTFQPNRPKNAFPENLYTYDPPGSSLNAGFYAPLYSSSIVNWATKNVKEFELNTNPGEVNLSFVGSARCIDDSRPIQALSIHPEISNGDITNFEDGGGNYSDFLGGINQDVFFEGIASNIRYRIQGKTTGEELSFIAKAQRGSIIKGIIELF